MSLKRKRTDKKEDGAELIQRVHQWESNVLGSQQALNDIVDILGVAKGERVEAAFVAVNSLARIFAGLWSKGLLRRTKDDEASKSQSQNPQAMAQAQVSDWLRDNYNDFVGLLKDMLKHDESPMQVTALKLLLQLVEREGESLCRASGGYEFPNASYLSIIEMVLDNKAASSHLLRTLTDSYLSSYDDLRFYFYRNIVKLASPDYDPFKKQKKHVTRSGSQVEEASVFARNTFTVLNSIRTPPKADKAEIASFWVSLPSELGQTEPLVLSPVAHKRAFSEAWLAYMRQPLTAEIYKQILLTMHKRIIPHMSDPKNLMDFLTNSYDAGGPVSLLALNGLFTLIDEYNLNYPQFYEKLFALLDRNLFHVKYRARFFRLLEIFLGSTHLPAYLVAAFIKRICRLALSAPPSGVVVAIPVVYNLLKAHPSCMVLIHRMPSYNEESGEEKISKDTDPFVADAKDPAKCCAIESSLWEMETLQTHYYPNIATLAKVFNEPFHKPKFLLEDFLDHTYTTFFESDTVRKPKKAPALAAQPPASLLRPGDAISDILSF
ncbi:Maturation and nuclear export of 40S ribosomal subunits interacting protein [Dipsacomyces acuminosporus]|nr:Maturation and nuclear export of 40S ribosomal subunits interacting protein [Dipsacomyces acuminosporus]